jgi:hypothetical protein
MGYDIWSGEPHFEAPTPRDQDRQLDRWLATAEERARNLRAFEAGEPVKFEGYAEPIVPVGYNERKLAEALQREGRNELLAARCTLEDAANSLEDHQASCDIFEENKTRKGGRGRGGKYHICQDCVSLTKGRDFAIQRVTQLQLQPQNPIPNKGNQNGN